MKRIVVTGATSMIGIALIEECIKNDVEVLAIIRKNSNRLYRLPQSELLHIVECDLDELETISSEKSYDVFYHLAWAYTSKEYRDDPILQEKNIRYTLDAVNLAKKLGCGKFVGAGYTAWSRSMTIAWCGTQPPVRWRPTPNLRPITKGARKRRLASWWGR